MDRDIKRLLSLRANPHFQLSPSELKQIEESFGFLVEQNYSFSH